MASTPSGGWVKALVPFICLCDRRAFVPPAILSPKAKRGLACVNGWCAKGDVIRLERTSEWQGRPEAAASRARRFFASARSAA